MDNSRGIDEQSFEAIVRRSSDVLLIMDRDANARYISPSVKILLGYDPEEIVGKSIFNFVHPDHLKNVLDQLKESIPESGASRTMALQIRHKNGEWVVLEGTGTNLLDDPIVNGFVINCKDATAQTRTRDALAASEVRLRAFLDATSDIAFLKNEKHEYVMANKICIDFFGKAESDIIGKTDIDLMPEEAARRCLVTDKEALESGKLTISEEAIGEQVFETHKFPFVLGKECYIGAIIRDVTA
ncbi:MAG: PAS domain S-box protein, partial [bacterium]